MRGADEPKYGDEEKLSNWKESIEMWLQARDGCGRAERRGTRRREKPGDEKESQ